MTAIARLARQDDPLGLLGTAKGQRYDREAITQLQHALQTAAWAEREGDRDALVIASLLHDIGHLLVPDAAAASEAGQDLHHEEIGARWLARLFGPEVSEPVRLHVAAKRHLARDPAYAADLSPESAHTLALQGGPFTDEEDAAFLALPFAQDAIRLRLHDDRAKDPDAVVPGVASYRARIETLRRR